MPTYTTTRFLADVKRLGHFPTLQSTFLDADLLALGDYELQTLVLPQIMSTREGYFLTYQDFPITTGIQQIPNRAIGGAVHAVQIITGNNVENLKYIEISQLESTLGSPVGSRAFYVQGNNVILTPVPTSGVLRLYYPSIPGQLVLTSACTQVQQIFTSSIIVASYPATFTVGTTVDFIKDASGFDTLARDVAITGFGGSTLIQFTSGTIPTGLAVGDWLSLSGTSPIPQIPVEAQPILVQATVVKVLEIQGYTQKHDMAQTKLKEMQSALMNLITPRIKENAKVIVNNDGNTLTPNRIGYNRYGRY